MRKAIYLFHSILVVLIITFVSGCSSKPSRPSESQVKKDVQKFILENWFWCKMMSFKKTNGEGDSQSYRIYYTAKFQITKDLKGYSRKGVGYHVCALMGFRWIKTHKDNVRDACKVREVKNGYIFEISHYENYKKTENGWVKTRSSKIRPGA